MTGDYVRRLSYPNESEVGGRSALGQLPVGTLDPGPGVETEAQSPRPRPRPERGAVRAERPPARPPQKQGPAKKQGPPKKGSDTAPLIWLVLGLVGGGFGVILYWKEMKIAAVVAAGWLVVLSILCLARAVYLIALGLATRLLRLSTRVARLIFLPTVFIFAGTCVWRIAPFLPFVDPMIDGAIARKLSTPAAHFVYVDSAGTELFSEGTRFVSADEAWDSWLRPAIIAVEDERHEERDLPIDPRSVVRAVYHNATSRGREGASTIQVQIVDLLFDDLGNGMLNGLLNKLFEWAVAMRLDARIPDRAVQLKLYCNLVPGAEKFQGAASLASDLFNVSDLRRLTPAQAATISASLKGIAYHPRFNPAQARQRRDSVLSKMRAQGYLSEEQFQEAVGSELSVVSKLKPRELFVRAARDEDSDFLARAAAPAARGGEGASDPTWVTPVFVVRLTLDPVVQGIAEQRVAEEVRQRVDKGSMPAGTDVAFVVVENATGAVLAAVPALGGELDLTRWTARDPGSTGKPLLAAAALTAGAISPGETFADAGPMSFGSGLMRNYGGHYSGRRLTIDECIERSSNVCMMQIQERMRGEAWAARFSALGLPQPRSFAKIGIGDNWPIPILRLAAAYTALPNGGEMALPRYVSAFEGPGGVRAEALAERRRVFDPAACRVVIEGMRACLRSGTGRAAASESDVAWGKTGTTSDSMAVIQTRGVTAVVWVGARATNEDLKTTGGALAMRLLAGFVRGLKRARPELAPASANA